MTNDMKVVFTIEEAIGELSACLAREGKQPLSQKELREEVETGLTVGFEVLEELRPEHVYGILNTDAFQMVVNDPNPLQAFHLNVAVEAVKHYLEAGNGKALPYTQADIGFLPTVVLIFKGDANGSDDEHPHPDLP